MVDVNILDYVNKMNLDFKRKLAVEKILYSYLVEGKEEMEYLDDAISLLYSSRKEAKERVVDKTGEKIIDKLIEEGVYKKATDKDIEELNNMRNSFGSCEVQKYNDYGEDMENNFEYYFNSSPKQPTKNSKCDVQKQSSCEVYDFLKDVFDGQEDKKYKDLLKKYKDINNKVVDK